MPRQVTPIGAEAGGTHFFAMSMFFYALDCVRELLPPSLDGAAPSVAALAQKLRRRWPTPSLEDVDAAAREWCKLDWGARSSRHARAVRPLLSLGTHNIIVVA